MNIPIFVFWLLSLILVIWLQFRYREEDFPNTARWRMLLFASGFANTSVVTLIIAMSGEVGSKNHEMNVSMLLSILGAVLGGTLFAFAFPYQMRSIYPKRVVEAKNKTTKRTE